MQLMPGGEIARIALPRHQTHGAGNWVSDSTGQALEDLGGCHVAGVTGLNNTKKSARLTS
jgi:hypothetical protein